MRFNTDANRTSTLEDMVRRLEESGDLYVEVAKNRIAEHIFLAMSREEVSKAELARRLGKSRAYVTQILHGSVNFTIESLVRIATVLDCDLDIRLWPNSMVHRWDLESSVVVSDSGQRDDEHRSVAANNQELSLAA